MTLEAILVVSAALVGLGVWGALSQQSFVMIMMGVELALNGAMLATVGAWALAAGGPPKGQLLLVIVLAVMAIELTVGFALVAAVYRGRQADMTESIDSLRG